MCDTGLLRCRHRHRHQSFGVGLDTDTGVEFWCQHRCRKTVSTPTPLLTPTAELSKERGEVKKGGSKTKGLGAVLDRFWTAFLKVRKGNWRSGRFSVNRGGFPPTPTPEHWCRHRHRHRQNPVSVSNFRHRHRGVAHPYHTALNFSMNGLYGPLFNSLEFQILSENINPFQHFSRWRLLPSVIDRHTPTLANYFPNICFSLPLIVYSYYFTITRS